MSKEFLYLISDYLDGRGEFDHFMSMTELFDSKVQKFSSESKTEQGILLNELKDISAAVSKINFDENNRFLKSKQRQINLLVEDLEAELKK
jgi:hypothetical protein